MKCFIQTRLKSCKEHARGKPQGTTFKQTELTFKIKEVEKMQSTSDFRSRLSCHTPTKFKAPSQKAKYGRQKKRKLSKKEDAVLRYS